MLKFLQRFSTVVSLLFLLIRMSFAQEPVLVQVYYSGYADECSWEIVNTQDNSIVLSGGPGPISAPPYYSYNQTINFIPGEYKFIAYDSYGDGWPSPQAWYKVNPSTGIGTGVVNFLNGNIQETPFTVFSSDDIDLGMISWVSPVSSPGLTTTEDVSIKFRNYGIDTINSLSVSYSTNGGTSFLTEIYSNPVYPQEIVDFTFVQSANFSNPGVYSCIAYIAAIGDLMTDNDTIYLSVTSYASINTFPWLETFTLWPPEGWSFDGTESWLSYANTSAFCNFYYWNQGSAEMITPPLNIYAPATLSFKWSSTLNEYSLDDEMQVLVSSDFGQTWDLVLEKTGIYLNSFDGATSQSPGSFLTEQIDLTSYTNEIIYVKFVGSSNLGSNLYVDNVGVNLNPANDLSLTEWVYPPEKGCGLGSSEHIIVNVKNTGASTVNGFNLAYSISGGSSYTVETVNQTIVPGQTIQYTFSAIANFSAAGVFNCQALVINPGDNVLTNDMLQKTVKSINSINTFPFIETFQSTNSNYFQVNSESYANAAIVNVGSNYVLKMDGGPAAYGWIGSSTGTLPSVAWYINISHKSYLHSCMVNATNLTTLELLFDLKQYYKYGPAYSFFRVLIDGVQVADDNGTMDFHPVTESSDPFQTIRFDLSSYAGTQFELTLESSNKFSSLTNPPGNVSFVDNIIIREIAPPDAAIVSLVSPETTCNLSSAEIIEIQVQNNGGEEINSYNLAYKINGGPFITNAVNIPVQPGTTLNYTFPQTGDFSSVGQYLVTVVVSLAGDLVPANDTITYLVENLSQLPVEIIGLNTSYCIYDQQTLLSGNPSGGTFSGPGIVGNMFNPLVAGSGVHTITYSVYNQSAGCTSIANQNVTINGQEVNFSGLYTGPPLVPVLVQVFYNSNWVFEQSWKIIDEAGNIIITYPSGTSSSGYSFNGTINLPFGTYTFIAQDTYGDGWNSSWYNVIPDFGTGTGVQTYVVPPSQQPVNQQTSQFVVGGQSFMCIGDPAVTLVGTPAQGIFTGTGVTGTIFNPSLAGVGVHSISYTFTNINGCVGVNTQQVTIEQLPVVNLGPDVVVCQGTNVLLDAGQVYEYLWNTGATTQSINVLNSGNYSVTVSTELGCEGYDQVNVTANPIPPVNFGPDQDLCAGNTVSLNAGAGSTYIWNDGSTQNSLIASTTGDYSVTVTSSEGCIGSDSIQLTFHQVNLNLGPNQSICQGDTLVLYPGSYYSFLWSNGTTNQTLEVFSPNIYSVTVSDQYGCTASDNISIYVNPLPYVSLGPDLVIEDTVIVLDPGIFSSYLWSDGSNSGVYVVDGSTLPPGPTLIWVEITNSNGCSKRDTIIIEALQTEQIITLVSGWSIISSYIYPYLPSIDSVFAPVFNNVLIVKNGSGLVYWPAFGLNLIGNMMVGEGYQVSMNSLQYLTVSGDQAIPENTVMNIPQGWSIIGYLRITPAPADIMLASIASNVLIVKNGLGQVYWPSFGLNMIGNMIPGQGYQISMSAPVAFSYPPNGATNMTSKHEIACKFFNSIENTGHNMTLCLPYDSWEIYPELGDEIGIFNESGKLVGGSVFTGGNTAVTIWGDDPYTSGINGLTQGESYSIKIWNNIDNSTMTVDNLIFSKGNEYYYDNAISIAGKISLINENKFILYQNYPNPFSEKSIIEFYIPEETFINISIYSVLGEFIETICNQTYSSGKNKIELSSNLSAGVYYYRFSSEKFNSSRKFNVLSK